MQRIHLGFWLVCLAFSLSLSRAAPAQDSLHIRQVSSLGLSNSIADVELSGVFAYCAAYGNGLLVLDVSNPTQPRHLSGCRTGCFANAVALSGDYAYVAQYDNNVEDMMSAALTVVDIADPSHPVPVGYWGTNEYCFDVELAGSFAFVASMISGIHVLDVSDPALPVDVAVIDSALTNDCTVANGYLYAMTACQVQIYDVRDPVHPVYAGSFAGAGLPEGCYSGLTVEGNLGFATDTRAGLYVLDFTNPAVPQLVGLAEIGNHPVQSPVRDGDYVYATIYNEFSGGIAIFDVSDPAQPAQSGYWEESEWGVKDLAVAEGLAYMAGDWNGFFVMNVADPARPAVIGEWETGDEAKKVVLFGDYAVMGGDDYRYLTTVDVSYPEWPVIAGVHRTDGSVYDLAACGDFMVTLTPPSGVTLYDMTNPELPLDVGHIRDIGPAMWFALHAEYLYIGRGREGRTLEIWSLADPTDPCRVNSMPLIAGDPVTNSRYLYTDGYNWVSVYSLVDPAHPALIDSISSWGQPIAASDEFLLLNDDHQVRVVEILPDGAHVLGGWIPVEFDYWMKRPVIRGRQAYLGAREDGLQVYSLDDPQSPELVGYYETPGDAFSMALRDDLLYLGECSRFSIYDCSELLPVESERTATPPREPALQNCYPNPFNNATTITFSLPATQAVALTVFDVTGRQVATLVQGRVEAGTHTLRFAADGLSSGIYFARLETSGFAQAQKLVLLK